MHMMLAMHMLIRSIMMSDDDKICDERGDDVCVFNETQKHYTHRESDARGAG